MRGERRLLRLGEYLIARACRQLPAETRDERYREWAAELPAILRDPDTRLAARRAARMLGYAAGTLWGTALAPGSARRLMARMAGIAARATICGVVIYLEGWAEDPEGLDWRRDRVLPRLPGCIPAPASPTAGSGVKGWVTS